jgi:hypothetical protein
MYLNTEENMLLTFDHETFLQVSFIALFYNTPDIHSSTWVIV